ncbi:hypothetical protein P152DRAFT_374178, partial [Eremomyces bilateralis CBS 781.70]
IDMKKFAQLAGYTEGSARNAFAAVRKKLRAVAQSKSTNGGTNSPTASNNKAGTGVATPNVKKATKRTPSSKKRARTATPSDLDDDEDTPSKRPRG